jgi:hypothetical protein
MGAEYDLWTSIDRRRWFVVPRGSTLPAGTFQIQTLTNESTSVDVWSLSPFEVTEDQARRWLKDQLGHTLDELKHGIDDKLADWRRQLDEFNTRPVTDDTTITPDAATALFDFLKQLPRVVGQSISGDDDRVAVARDAMARLEEQLKRSGIDVGDRLKNFPDRLSELRKNSDKARK